MLLRTGSGVFWRGRPLKGPLSREKTSLLQGENCFLVEGTTVLLTAFVSTRSSCANNHPKTECVMPLRRTKRIRRKSETTYATRVTMLLREFPPTSPPSKRQKIISAPWPVAETGLSFEG
jgi:hypothetical protein